MDDFELKYKIEIFSDLSTSILKWFICHVGSVPGFFWRKNMPKQRVMGTSVCFSTLTATFSSKLQPLSSSNFVTQAICSPNWTYEIQMVTSLFLLLNVINILCKVTVTHRVGWRCWTETNCHLAILVSKPPVFALAGLLINCCIPQSVELAGWRSGCTFITIIYSPKS